MDARDNLAFYPFVVVGIARPRLLPARLLPPCASCCEVRL
jgi:hypothetical protein